MYGTLLAALATLGAASVVFGSNAYYYRRRRTYNPFSFSFTRCCTSIITAIAGIVVVLLLTGVVKGQDIWTLIIVCIVVGVVLAVLYLFLRYGRKKSTSTKSSSSSRRTRSTSRSREDDEQRYRSRNAPQAPRYSSKDEAASTDAETSRYALSSTPASSSTSKSSFVPRDDVEPGAEGTKKTSARKKKSGFFDGAETPAEQPPKVGGHQAADGAATAARLCPKCNKAVADGAKFCGECGNRM